VNWWQGIVLGLVQGLTEFLPVSSSGHLVVAERLLGVHTPGVFVEVALHVATLGSVFVVYGGRIIELGRGLVTGDGGHRTYVWLLVLATVPAGLAGVLLGDVIERAFDSLVAVGLAFLLTGTILWSTRRLAGQRDAPTTAGAIGMGLMQAVAILPGVSRAGSTVAAGLWTGLTPQRAAEFSFLMAVPTIGGAAALQLREAAAGLGSVGMGPLVLACVAAFAAGVWAIRFLVALLRRGRFHAFAPYCWTLGVVTLIATWWTR
jgi:undecaprenyl-diphosphatase